MPQPSRCFHLPRSLGSFGCCLLYSRHSELFISPHALTEAAISSGGGRLTVVCAGLLSVVCFHVPTEYLLTFSGILSGLLLVTLNRFNNRFVLGPPSFPGG